MKYWARFTALPARDLGLGALMALFAAVVLATTAPVEGFNGFCVGILFGLSSGIGVFAVGAFSRGRTRG